MKTPIKILLSLIFLATYSFAMAQEEEEEATEDTFVYATYFYCNPALEEAADAEVEAYWKPAYDAAVEAGTIKAWGYFGHHTGGRWRRLQYTTAGSIDDLLKAQASVGEAIDKATPEDAGDDFGAACASHDDYIWQLLVSDSGITDADNHGGAVMATYHVCSFSGHDRADEIVENDFAPIYNKYVENGSILGWGWLSHVVGGKIRRIDTMTAKDIPTLLKARGEIIAEIIASEAGDEFDDICTSHTDYLWNVIH